jgi:hypothetical protein
MPDQGRVSRSGSYTATGMNPPTCAFREARSTMDRNRHMATRTAHPVDKVHPVSDTTSGALLVDFDSVLGQDRKPFDQTKLGTTVTATVTIRSIADMAGGHCRGIIDGDGGYAIFYLPRDYKDRLRHLLTEGATVKVRGTHTLVGMLPTIGIFAARAVDA